MDPALLQVETDDDKVIIKSGDGTCHLFENATIVPLIANKNYCDDMRAEYEVETEKLGVFTLMRHRSPTVDTPSYRILFLANGFEIRFSGLAGFPSALVVPSTQCLPAVPKEHLVLPNMPAIF